MKNYSSTFLGLIATVGLPLIVSSTGISDSCVSEVFNWTSASAIPGLLLIWKTRMAKGDINALGFKKQK